MAKESEIRAAIRQRYEWPSGRALYASCTWGPVCLACLRRARRDLQTDPTLKIEAAQGDLRCFQCKGAIQ